MRDFKKNTKYCRGDSKKCVNLCIVRKHPQMYRIYIFEEIEQFNASDFERACAIVSEARIAKAKSYLHAKDRNLSVIAELLLRHALLDTYTISELPEMHYTHQGKPMLLGENMPYFNISHCDLAVACAISDKCIGIDVEPYSSYSDEVAQEVFNDAELAYVDGSPKRFAELWTIKESYLKYTGEGLTDHLKSLLTNSVAVDYHTVYSPREYACTVCAANRDTDTTTYVNKVTLLNG